LTNKFDVKKKGSNSNASHINAEIAVPRNNSLLSKGLEKYFK